MGIWERGVALLPEMTFLGFLEIGLHREGRHLRVDGLLEVRLLTVPIVDLTLLMMNGLLDRSSQAILVHHELVLLLLIPNNPLLSALTLQSALTP